MPEFILLEEIKEMPEEERKWLNRCRVKKGYFDPADHNFVIKVEAG